MQFSLSNRDACYAVAFLVALLAACESPDRGVTSPLRPDSILPAFGATAAVTALGEPFANLTADELARFAAGKEEFEAEEGVDEGLGPVFNEAACVTCHSLPVGGTTGRVETRFGRTRADGSFDPMSDFGGSLIQDQGLGDVGGPPATHTFVGEAPPAEATITAQRITTQLFGLGLVDAVPDVELIRLAQFQATYTAATAGTPNMVTEISSGRTRVGRFGWKAQVPTLHQFSGDAYLNEMGITNPEFPAESCPQGDCAALAFNPMPALNDDGGGVDKFTDFMTLLAPPPRGPRTLQVIKGSGVFSIIGCANCHTPVLVTGPSPVAALSGKVFQPFSDFLLHDMGSLGDGIVQGGSTPRQMRTAPLWGVSTRPALLHDGRAATIDAAILAHDGQGRRARNRFVGLGPRARESLLAFLNSL